MHACIDVCVCKRERESVCVWAGGCACVKERESERERVRERESMRARLHVCSWDAYTAVCAHMYVHVHTRMMHMLGINVCGN